MLLEGDPPAISGRMSFQNFKTGPKTAYQGAEADAEDNKQEGVSVDDEAMAARLVHLFYKWNSYIFVLTHKKRRFDCK